MSKSDVNIDIPTDAFFMTSLADHANDIILATEADDIDLPKGPRIVYCNAAFERFSGWTREEIVGRTPRILQARGTDRGELDKIRAALTAWKNGDQTARCRVILKNRHRNGEEYWTELDLFPVWCSENNRAYWISVQRDMTARVENERIVANALERAEAARSTQEEFIAKVSHDMRTPLNAVLGFANVLSSGVDGPLTDAQKRCLSNLEMAGRQLRGLVNDLIDMALIARDQLKIEVEPANAAEIISYVVAVTEPAASHLSVSVVMADDLSAKILCDGIRARQCVTNILDNAIKFSPLAGTVTISVNRCKDDRVAIAIRDEGPGLSDPEIKTALALFGQVGPAEQRRPGAGVGLGLPIVAQLMRLQGGELRIQSKPHEGSTFSLIFPAA